MPITAFTLLIFYVSSVPGDALPDFVTSWTDKALHAGAFFVYGVACLIAVCGWNPWWSVGRIQLVALGLGGMYGALDEVHQSFVVGRDSNMLDWGADMLGLSLALLLARFIRAFFR
jgi:VanZ family protein